MATDFARKRFATGFTVNFSIGFPSNSDCFSYRTDNVALQQSAREMMLASATAAGMTAHRQIKLLKGRAETISREHVPAMHGQFEGSILTYRERRIAGELGEQGHAVHFNLEQRRVSQIIAAGNFAGRCSNAPIR
jgi:hypothetical protein